MFQVDRSKYEYILEIGDGSVPPRITFVPKNSMLVLDAQKPPFPVRVEEASEENLERLYDRVTRTVQRFEKSVTKSSIDDVLASLKK